MKARIEFRSNACDVRPDRVLRYRFPPAQAPDDLVLYYLEHLLEERSEQLRNFSRVRSHIQSADMVTMFWRTGGDEVRPLGVAKWGGHVE